MMITINLTSSLKLSVTGNLEKGERETRNTPAEDDRFIIKELWIEKGTVMGLLEWANNEMEMMKSQTIYQAKFFPSLWEIIENKCLLELE